MASTDRRAMCENLPERVVDEPGANLPEVDITKLPGYLQEPSAWQQPNSPVSQLSHDKRLSESSAVAEPQIAYDINGENATETKKPKTICGLRKRWFFTLLLGAFLAIAIGFGVGLGIGLSKSNNDETQGGGNGTNTASNMNRTAVNVLRNTGIAATVDSDGQEVLLYYQLFNGSLVEELHSLANFSASGLNYSFTASNRSIIDAANIADGSALAIVSFNQQKYLFYTDSGSYLYTTNSTTAEGTWSDAGQLHTEQRYLNQTSSAVPQIIPHSPALAACYFADVGVRLYHGLSGPRGRTGVGQIAKTEWDFLRPGSTGTYKTWTAFDADAWAGIACSGTFNNDTGFLQDVYMKGSQDDVFYLRETGTSTELHGDLNLRVTDQYRLSNYSAIAAATNTRRTGDLRTTIFFRGEDMMLKKLNYTLPGPQSPVPVSTTIRLGEFTKLAAVWPNDDGVIVVYEGAPGRIHATMFDDSGNIVANNTLSM